jgi:hypothetical protein
VRDASENPFARTLSGAEVRQKIEAGQPGGALLTERSRVTMRRHAQVLLKIFIQIKSNHFLNLVSLKPKL